MDEKTIRALIGILTSVDRNLASGNVEGARSDAKDAKNVLTKEAARLAEEEAMLLADLDELEKQVRFPDDIPLGSRTWM